MGRLLHAVFLCTWSRVFTLGIFPLGVFTLPCGVKTPNEMRGAFALVGAECLASRTKNHVAKNHVAKNHVAKHYVAKHYVTKHYVTRITHQESRYKALRYKESRYMHQESRIKAGGGCNMISVIKILASRVLDR